MRDVKDEGLIAAGQDEHGFRSGVSSSFGLEPGDMAEARYSIALKKS